MCIFDTFSSRIILIILIVNAVSGVSLPLPVAATFGLKAPDVEDGIHTPGISLGGVQVLDYQGLAMGGKSIPNLGGLAEVARLDSLVTVVDAQRFVSNVLAAESLQERGLAVDENDDRTVADLLIEQVWD